MSSLSKSLIMAARDVTLEEIHVSEWGGSVWMKTLSGTERDIFEDGYAADKMKAFRPRFLVLALCNENGDRLFTDAEVAELGKKSSVVLNRLFDAGWKLNALREEDTDALGEGSPSDQSADSTSV